MVHEHLEVPIFSYDSSPHRHSAYQLKFPSDSSRAFEEKCFFLLKILGSLESSISQLWLLIGITWKVLNKTWCPGSTTDQFHRIWGRWTKGLRAFSQLSRSFWCITKVENADLSECCVLAQSLSHVRLFVTLWTVVCLAPLSMGYSKQEYWSVLPFSIPGNLPDPGIELVSPVSLLHWQADSLLLSHLGRSVRILGAYLISTGKKTDCWRMWGGGSLDSTKYDILIP